jgi:hypothetical protein
MKELDLRFWDNRSAGIDDFATQYSHLRSGRPRESRQQERQRDKDE